MHKHWIMELPASTLGITLPALVALVLAVAPPTAHASNASVMPDFYSEPGLNPFRDQVNANVTEHIDPFSGGLALSYVDLFIPGEGGLDIAIRRTYNSNNVYASRSLLFGPPYLQELLYRTPTGMGWTMHFGRVIRSGSVPLCQLTTTTADNPVLELPDGSKHILYENATSFNALFVTKTNWVAYCLGGTGLLVISPDGIKYTMNYYRNGGSTYTSLIDNAYYTTRIEDPNGNYITINYNSAAAANGANAIFSSISASDGRSVSFGYTDVNDSSRIRLTSITANGQTWNYGYTQVTDSSAGHWQLTRVTRPDGRTWNYTYHVKTSYLQAGHRVLDRVTYPYGATVSYDYDYICFNDLGYGCGTSGTYYTLAVRSKANGGRDVAGGTWTYSYAPSRTEDVTTVNFPDGKHIYKHYGSQLSATSSVTNAGLWRIGLLKEKLTYDGSSLVHREVYTWDNPYVISNEQEIRAPYGFSDPRIYVPVLLRRDIVRDGTTYTTTYSNFDASFNPRTISESGQDNRTTDLTYFPRNANQNIVSRVKDEVLSGESSSKSIYRVFDTQGNVTELERHGVKENYSYFTTGDLARRTNARSQNWTYGSYHRGIPRSESHPAGVSISRSVNNSGTIASETNGRGKTTSYSYNDMNQLTGINPPAGSGISIAWSSTGRTLTRGGYSQAVTFDGFGRPSLITTEGITQNINYNALGHKSFQSYLDSSGGDSYGTDVLGRVESVSHADGSSRSYNYNSGNRVTLSNERSNTFTYQYRSFGDPDRDDERVLMQTTAPEGMTTSFNRDILGNITSIAQGSVTRSYGYNSSNFVVSETNPETGTTVYGRDAVGNLTSRRVGGSSTTTYTYDGLNRLTDINYPGSTPDVTLGYDDNSNLTLVDNGVARRVLSYDNNDNLTTEALTVGGNTFTAEYGYDSLDYLASVRYPSGRSVSYAPDDLGRPTRVSPYLTSAAHHPNGVPQTLQYANGQTATTSLTPRQWLAGIATQGSGQSAVDLVYDYDGLANVTSILNRLDSRDSKSLSYDGVDRLTQAGTASISYNAQDNITAMSSSLGNLSYSYSSNRLSNVSGYKSLSLSYDDYGNVTGLGPYTFGYDDAATLRTVTGGTTASYDYDGKALRVRAVRGGVETLYFYALDGRLWGEYDPSGLWTKEYAYLGTKLIAAPENPDTDGDGLRDSQDNCPTVANPDQTDTDANGIGDACEPPTLSGFWPGGGPAGTKVWVFGAHFVPLARQTHVTVGGVPANLVQVVSPELLIFFVPSGVVSGPIVVTTAAGSASSAPHNFNDPVSPGLRLDGLWPATVAPGDFVWLFGAGFNPAAGQTQVTVNGTRCYAQVIDPGLLVFFVATGATSGPVTVTVAGVTATSPTNLTIRSTAPAAGATVGAPTAAAAAPEKITYYHFDALGSPVAATNEQGQVIWRERYEPYGDRIDKPPASQANTRWHTGHVQDPDTGLVYAGARYYDPTLGRFLSMDPQGPDPNSLHSINRYVYGNNNPYKYIDPDGEAAETVLDAISLGLSIKEYRENPTFWNGVGVAIDAAGTAIPFVPAGVGTIRAVGKGLDQVEDAAQKAISSRAARREAMREQGIPTSQQPTKQLNTPAGRQYEYEVPATGGGKQKMVVTDQKADRVPGHGPHWEAGRAKVPERKDPMGRTRVSNDKSKVNY